MFQLLFHRYHIPLYQYPMERSDTIEYSQKLKRNVATSSHQDMALKVISSHNLSSFPRLW